MQLQLREVNEELKSHGFSLIQRVGQGGFATIFTVCWNQNPGKVFAAKVLPFNGLSSCPTYDVYLKEITILQSIQHPNIIRVYEYFKSNKYLYIILDYYEYGNLEDYILCHGPLNEQYFKLVSKQILEAIKVCHQANVTHRDMKPSNILLDQSLKIIISDFGLADMIKDGTLICSCNGSMQTQSIEELMKKPHDPKCSEVWSLGVIFYFLITGEFPYYAETQSDLINQINKCELIFPHGVPYSIKQLVSAMLNKNPALRPSCHELLQFQFFLDNDSIINRKIAQSFTATKLVPRRKSISKNQSKRRSLELLCQT